MNWVKRACARAVGVWLVVLSPSVVWGQVSDSLQKNSPSQPTVAPVAPPACHCIGEESSSSAAKIRAALGNPLKPNGLDFAGTPLEQVVNSICDEYDISVQLDLPALQDAGLNPQEPVTVGLHGISLKSAMRLMLKQHQLTYIIQNEVLIITTPEQAETCIKTCVYDVRDLLNGGGDAEGRQSLIQAITSCVARESWAENGGGPATIRPLKPGLLVISQTQAVHEEVRELLEAVRRSQQQPAGNLLRQE